VVNKHNCVSGGENEGSLRFVSEKYIDGLPCPGAGWEATVVDYHEFAIGQMA
jgi:hypothetical protein